MPAGPARNPAFPWTALAKPLSGAERAALARTLRDLLAWQQTLARFSRPRRAPDATPFFSLYARGRLRGCFGSTEGAAGERLARAFLRALEDTRYGGIAAAERAGLVAEVAYPIRPARVTRAELERRFEIGTHGLAASAPDRQPALLLPRVASDERADLPALLQVLARKSGGALDSATLFLFEVESVVARRGGARTHRAQTPEDAAARWLAARIDGEGRVAFAVDARARTTQPAGVFHHGRAATVIQALDAHGGYPHEVVRARRWLAADARAALAGRAVAGWPAAPAAIAGTLALAVRAGVDLEVELGHAASEPEAANDAWHAAQVVAALGPAAPERLWRACVSDLERRPWAPWTALAARAVGDRDTARRADRVLAASIRRRAPHAGACSVTRVPEIALTAVTVEALAAAPARAARASVERATEFLRRAQLHAGSAPPALDPALVDGAFPTTLVLDVLRADVTAHALSALLAVR